MNDFELMVNKNSDVRCYAMQRAAAQRKKRQVRKAILRIGVLAATAIGSVILGEIGAISYKLAAVVTITAAMAASFTLGLYWAMVRRK